MAVITGASKGIGRALVLRLLNEYGCDVIAVARDAAALESLAQEVIPAVAQLQFVVGDVSAPPTLDAIVEAIGGRRLNVLVNNAGLLLNRPFGTWGFSELEEVFRSNAFAPMLLVQRLAPHLGGEEPGHVVNISSMGAFQGSSKFPGLMGYSASKAALACATECMAEELKEQGIRCNCLCLGAVDTDMLRAAFPGYRAQVSAETAALFIAEFSLTAHKVLNGKILPVSLSTP